MGGAKFFDAHVPRKEALDARVIESVMKVGRRVASRVDEYHLYLGVFRIHLTVRRNSIRDARKPSRPS